MPSMENSTVIVPIIPVFCDTIDQVKYVAFSTKYMLEYVSKIKQKMLEFTRLFCLETSIFQRFVIIYKYIYFLNSDPLAKNILQGIFDDTTKTTKQKNRNEFRFFCLARGVGFEPTTHWLHMIL